MPLGRLVSEYHFPRFISAQLNTLNIFILETMPDAVSWLNTTIFTSNKTICSLECETLHFTNLAMNKKVVVVCQCLKIDI